MWQLQLTLICIIKLFSEPEQGVGNWSGDRKLSSFQIQLEDKWKEKTNMLRKFYFTWKRSTYVIAILRIFIHQGCLGSIVD